MLEDWIDFSNWQGVPTSGQAECIRGQLQGAVAGLQDAGITRMQKAVFGDFIKEHYVDLPGRDLTIPDRGSIVWIDIEKGCFQSAGAVRNERRRIEYFGLKPGIYTNEGGMAALGFTTEFSDLPLWYANPDLINFSPLCGWTEMLMWQRTGTVELCGYGMDMNKRLVADPVPEPPPDPNQTDVLWALSRALNVALREAPYNDLIEDDRRVFRWLVTQF